jgi:hypothetical protein
MQFGAASAMRDDDATATPPATNEATTELTAHRNFRRLPATGRASIAPPGMASVTPIPWPRPARSIDLEGAWNAIVRSVPFRHARSSHAVGCSHRYPGTPWVPRTEPPEMPDWEPRPPGTWPEAGTGSRAARRGDPFVAMTPNRPPDTTGTHP